MLPDRSPMRVSDLTAESVLVIDDGYRAKNEELASAGLPFVRAGNIDEKMRLPKIQLARLIKGVAAGCILNRIRESKMGISVDRRSS